MIQQNTSPAVAPALPEGPLTLPVIQVHRRDFSTFIGWDKDTIAETILLLTEEMGELAKAVRNLESISIEKAKAKQSSEVIRKDFADELADVFGYVLQLANRYGVDLESAYRAKMAENALRKWE